MKKLLLASVISAILAGCGGGGADSPKTAIAISGTNNTQHVIQLQPIVEKNVSLGYYDDSHYVNMPDSFFHAWFNRWKSMGYTGVTFKYNVNVDQSGLVLDTLANERLFKHIAYIKSLGMTVSLTTNWVLNNTQTEVSQWYSVTNGFNTELFLQGVNKHYANMGVRLQASNVNKIYIGHSNNLAVTDQYVKNWELIIGNLRKIYNGKISYITVTGWYPIHDVKIWGLVDEIGLLLATNMGDKPLYNIQEIESLYFKTVSDNKEVNQVADWISLSQRYNKKINFFVHFGAFDTTLNGIVDPAIAGHTFDRPLSVNQEVQKMAFTATLNLLNKNMSQSMAGYNLGEYDLWVYKPVNSYAITNDSSFIYTTWKNFQPSENPLTEFAISQFLTNDLSFRVSNITTGNIGDDIIYLSTGLNDVYYQGGSDKIYGGTGVDTIIFSKPISSYELITGKVLDKTNSKNIVSYDANIEKLKFYDTEVVLKGN